MLNTFAAGPGDTLVVLGAGAVGLAAVMAATAAGASTVAVDRHPRRLSLAERFGAIPLPVGTAGTAGLAERIRRLTDGGAQYALDTTASAPLINDALRALRPTGSLGLVARLHTPLSLEPGTLDRGRSIRHICEGDAVPGVLIPRLIGLWQTGRFPFDQLIRTYPLAGINEAERDWTRAVWSNPSAAGEYKHESEVGGTEDFCIRCVNNGHPRPRRRRCMTGTTPQHTDVAGVDGRVGLTARPVAAAGAIVTIGSAPAMRLLEDFVGASACAGWPVASCGPCVGVRRYGGETAPPAPYADLDE
ncbi:hypothetical protein SGLAM104S_08300 [Streptomyces glaucescens]